MRRPVYIARKYFSSPANQGLKEQEPPFFRSRSQPGLHVNAPNDVYEQQADAMADKVVNNSPKTGSRVSPSLPITGLQRKCAHCEEEGKLQRKENGSADNTSIATTVVQETLAAGGEPIAKDARNFMEENFGYDFSRVQIHNDATAHQSASSVNALAYTHGNHIVFGAGQYQPQTTSGKHLLAHELTHVLQQSNNGPSLQRKSYLQGEGITADRTVDDAKRLKEVILKTFSNPKGVLYKYIQGKTGKFTSDASISVDDPETFGYKYNKVYPDSNIKDKDVKNSVQGFVDPKHQYNIYLWQQSKYCHAFHEAVHAISNLNLVLSFFGGFLNEGLTQYFTDLIFIDETGSACKAHNYGSQLVYATKLVALVGQDVMANIFFTKDISKLDALAKIFGLKDMTALKAFKEKRGIEDFLKKKYKLSEDYK